MLINMKILFKAKTIEVKRAFVIAQKMRSYRKSGYRYLPKLARTEFLKKLKRAKLYANKLNEKKLDKIIAAEYPKRAISYSNSAWYVASASKNELGVWRRAGGLPADWTCGSLAQTAYKVMHGLRNKSKYIRARSRRAIPRIMDFIDIISKEKFLSPIVFAGGTGTQGRKRCVRKMRGDIDDGCMRAIALVLSGSSLFNIYFGKPK